MAYGIREDPRVFCEPPLPSLQLEAIVLLPSHNEASPDILNVVKTIEVVVASVEDVEGVLLVRYGIHRLHVVDSFGSEVEEGWDLGLDVVQRMHLDSSLPHGRRIPRRCDSCSCGWPWRGCSLSQLARTLDGRNTKTQAKCELTECLILHHIKKMKCT